MESLIARLDAFAGRPSERGNVWIEEGPPGALHVQLYVRRAMRVVPWQAHKPRLDHVLDLSSIEIAEEYRGRGHFKALVAAAQRIAVARGYAAVYIENVLNKRLAAGVRAWEGWTETGGPCFWWRAAGPAATAEAPKDESDDGALVPAPAVKRPREEGGEGAPPPEARPPKAAAVDTSWLPAGATPLQYWVPLSAEEAGCKLCAGGKTCKRVYEFSRHTDVPATAMDEVLRVLAAGHARYLHPRYARNAEPHAGAWLTACLQPGITLSWWTKDPVVLAAAFASRVHGPLLRRFGHHFSVTLHADNAEMEPGIKHTLTERLAALESLQRIGPVHVHAPDPVIFYWNERRQRRTNAPLNDELGAWLQAHDIGTVHSSFLQAGGKWSHVARTFEARGWAVDSEHLDSAYHKGNWVKVTYIPWLRKWGLTATTCTGPEVVQGFLESEAAPYFRTGVCVSYRDLKLASVMAGLPFNVKREAKSKSTGRKGCGCQQTYDMGCDRTPCGHGCVYCFAHPSARGPPPPIRDIEEVLGPRDPTASETLAQRRALRAELEERVRGGDAAAAGAAMVALECVGSMDAAAAEEPRESSCGRLCGATLFDGMGPDDLARPCLTQADSGEETLALHGGELCGPCKDAWDRNPCDGRGLCVRCGSTGGGPVCYYCVDEEEAQSDEEPETL